jgi:branched-chain amino acid transport system permease protein
MTDPRAYDPVGDGGDAVYDPQAPSVWSRLFSPTGQGIILLLLMIVLPFLVPKGFRQGELSIVLFVEVYLVLALGLNLVVGFTGLLDLGYVVFMATGAVTAVFLAGLRKTADGVYDWPIGINETPVGDLVFGFDGSIFVILLIAGVVCAVLGVLRGIPTLRVRGDYFAIVTLGFAEIMYETALWDETNPLNFTRLTGGAFGAKLASPDRPVLFGERLFWDTPQFYYLTLFVVVLTIFVSHHVNDSRTGRALAAVRLDETAARACGVNVSRYKLIAFGLSGFIGGIGGAMYAVWTGTVAVKSLDVWQSILILCCIVLGGMGSIRGVVFGTVVLMSLGEILREDIGGISIPPEARFLIYGLLLILVMRFRPQGILPANRRGKPLPPSRERELREGECALYTLGDQETTS